MDVVAALFLRCLLGLLYIIIFDLLFNLEVFRKMGYSLVWTRVHIYNFAFQYACVTLR
jgi:hypothetical protein